MKSAERLSEPVTILADMDAQKPAPARRATGIVTTAELKAQGKSPAAVKSLVGTGQLIPVRRGTYATAALADQLKVKKPARPGPDTAQSPYDDASRLLVRAAACMAAGDRDLVASHQTAAILHGLEVYGLTDYDVVLTRPPGRNRTGGRGVHIHSATLPAAHVSERLGLPVTTVARTVIDIARTASFASGVVVADAALRSKKTSKAELRSVLADCAKWPGVQLAAEIVEFADTRAESVLESIARAAFFDAGLPAPDLQVWVGGDDIVGRVDFLWREDNTIAEADGALKYADPSRAIAQLRRDAKLRDAGFEVVHFGWQDITRRPDEVTRAILAAFLRGAARRG